MTNKKHQSGEEQGSQGIIRINPSGGTFDLYKSYRLQISTTDYRTDWAIFLTTGPEDPPPSEGQPGHTVMFDAGSVRPSTQGDAYVNMMVVGPNTDTKITVYARALNDTDIGSAVFQFRAVQNPPKSTIGLLSVEGAPVQGRGDNPPNLISAAYMDSNGNPLQGEIQWTTKSYTPLSLLSAETQTAADGTTTNGIALGRTDSGAITATAPDGTSATLYTDAWAPDTHIVPGPSITINADTPPKNLTATYAAPDGTEVLWEAYPADQVKFAQRTTKVTNGSTSNTITYSSTKPFAAQISASSFNPQTTMRDYGNLELTLQQEATVVVTSTDTPPLSLYVPHELVATYTGENEQAITSYMWSVDPTSDPDHIFQFDPNPSQRDGDGKFKTQITAIGANTNTQVTVNARAFGLNDGKPHVGSINLPFEKVDTVPTKKFIDVESVDGNPLSTVDWHLVQALCTTATGDPLYPQSVTWNTSSPNIKLASANPTPTDQFGVATNLICATDPIIGAVGAWLTDDSGVFDHIGALTFEAGDVSLPGEGTMTFPSPPQAPMTLGEPHDVTVQYLDSNKNPMPKGTNIEWSGYPSDKLTLGRKITQVDDDNGNSSNTVTGLGTDDIPTVVITTRSYNSKTKEYDHGDLTTSFQHTAPPFLGLFGVMLDKAYCKNPGRNQKVDPKRPAQVIKCQIQVLGAQGQQTVTFPLNPEGGPVVTPPSLFDAKTFAPLQQQGGVYYTTTDAGSPPTATILVGSLQPQILTLGTGWKDQQDKQPAAKLVIASNNAEQSETYDAPTIDPAPVGGNLTFPPSTQWPAPTFKAYLPASSTLQPDDRIAFLLNDQLVYNGRAEPALNVATQKGVGVDLAYAAVMDDGSVNNLVYVVSSLGAGAVSSPLSFTGSGTAQTGPAGPSPTLPAPEVEGSPDSIGPDAIVSWITKAGLFTGGLPVKISPKAKVGDVVTVYFYLSGTDVLTGNSISNVVPVTYDVNAGDPLAMGGTATVYLPQWAAAGYSDGTLQIDYSIRGLSGTAWSAASPTYKLHTTF